MPLYENETLSRQTERQQRELALLAERFRELTGDLAVTRHELSVSQEYIAALTVERDGLRAENEALLSSTSWRMTGPLRAVVRFLTRR